MPTSQWEAYQNGTGRAMGLDHKRTQFVTDFGNYVANATTEFRAGMLVSLDSSQEVVICVGTNPYGVARYNKTNSLYETVVAEQIQLNGTTASNLGHANIFDPTGTGSGVRVTNTTAVTTYTEGGGADYTVNYTNGTVVRVGGSTITDGQYVLVTYQFALTAAEQESEGYNFWLKTNDVTIQDSRVTVITGEGIVFTTQFDPSQVYAVNTAVYSGATAAGLDGLFTARNTSGNVVGSVFQVPTAADPYLGVKLANL